MAVRREKVLLEVESDLAPTMLRDAAAVALLKRELRGLSGQAVTTARATQNIERDNDRIARSATKADTSINQLTGRLRLLADVAAILGPALGPIGAVGIAGIAGLANQFGVAALAAGAAIISFQGVGDALKAVNTAALDPTTANLEKARIALEQLSPAAQDMVHRLQELREVGNAIRDAGAEGMFPGVLDALDELEARAPDAERIIGSLGRTLGELSRDAGADLASGRWDEFFRFLATDASGTLAAMGRATGALAHGFAELWMAFDPLNDDFSSWVLDVANGFDAWATGLDQTEGLEEFFDYIRTTGPQVKDTVVALGDAVLQIVEASAPLGGPVLQALESVARIIASIADSNLGTPIMAAVTAMALLSRAQRTYESIAATSWGTKRRTQIGGMVTALGAVTTAQQRATLSARDLARVEAQRAAAVRTGLVTVGKGAAVLGALTLASTGAADGMGLTNSATLGLMGTLAGPLGAAVGTGVGFFLDAKSAVDDTRDSVDRFNDALLSGSTRDQRAEIERLRGELNGLTSLAPWEIGKWLGAGGDVQARIEEITRQIKELRGAVDAPETGKGISSLLGGALPAALGLTDAAFDSATQSALEFRQSMAKVSAALDGRADLRDFKAAIDDYRHALDEATESGRDFLNQNRTGFRTSTNLGRQMEAALDAIANSSLAAAENMKGMARTRFLDQARDQFINAARAAGLTKAAAKQLADQLGLVDRIKAHPKVEPEGVPETHRDVDGVDRAFGALDNITARPKVNVETGPAAAAIANIRSWLFNIPDERVNVIVNRIGGVTSSYGGHSAPDVAGAKGMTVPGPRFPYGDKVLSYLAPSEEVISNEHGQADRWRPLLKAINANRFADGGTVMVNAGRGSSAGVRVSAPVQVAAPQVRVFIDGDEVRAVVDSRVSDHRAHDAWSRPSYQGVDVD